jgi:hypothetical protein
VRQQRVDIATVPRWAAGVALLAVMAHPEVDPTRTVSNHLIEIIDVLGIEAARNALMKVPPLCVAHLAAPKPYFDALNRSLDVELWRAA